MTHRALQIVDAAANALSAVASLGARVYRHRTLSLSDADEEMPAAVVQMGDDAAENRILGASFDSRLELIVRLYVADADEEDAVDALMELRRQTHIALMTNPRLGLSFVTQTIYGGAEAPEANSEGGRVAYALNTRWTVDYRMALADPA